MKVEKKNSSYNESSVYSMGATRDVDEYNRRGQFRSQYQAIDGDSLGSDIIDFQAGTGIYPDSVYADTLGASPRQEFYDDDEYVYSRRMSRWDDYYGWYDPFYYRH